jgi:hypothetical protein
MGDCDDNSEVCGFFLFVDYSDELSAGGAECAGSVVDGDHSSEESVVKVRAHRGRSLLVEGHGGVEYVESLRHPECVVA